MVSKSEATKQDHAINRADGNSEELREESHGEYNEKDPRGEACLFYLFMCSEFVRDCFAPKRVILYVIQWLTPALYACMHCRALSHPVRQR